MKKFEMNVMRNIIRMAIVVAMICGICSEARSQSKNDSTSTTLKELTVTAENQKMSLSTTTYYPSSKVKRAAQDAIDLLKRMAINQIRVDPVTNKVTTDSREDVVVYINYIRAGQSEIDGLKSTDVSRVEYIDNPSDPRFEGNIHVVNIILQQYAYGGYTKISDRMQTISSFNNSASVFSRFAYRKITYDLYAGASYSNTTHQGYTTNSVFHLAEGTVNRNEHLKSSLNRSLSVPVTFRATYNTDNVSIANLVGFSFSDALRNEREGVLSMGHPGKMDDYSFRNSAPGVSRSINWNGNYFFTLPSKWSLSLIPKFTYTHSNNYSLYSSDAGVSDIIINNSRENAYNANLRASATKGFKGGNTLTLLLSGGYRRNKVDYSGSSLYSTDFKIYNLHAIAMYSIKKGDKFSATARVMLTGLWNETDRIKESSVKPSGILTLAYMPNKKNRFQLSLFQNVTSISGSTREDKVLRRNEYMYATGNPLLKSFDELNAILRYTFIAGNKFTFQTYCRYLGWYDRVVNTYSLYDNGNAVLYKPENSGDFTRLTTGVNLTLKLLSGSLILQGSPEFTHSSSTGFQHIHKNHFFYSVDAQYYFGDFNISASYQSREYTMGQITGEISRNAPFYSFQLGWANGNWSLMLTGYNLFRGSYPGQWDTMKSPVYETFTTNEIPSYHCTLSLGATYTFGYGKKVKRGGEIGATYGVESSALGGSR